MVKLKFLILVSNNLSSYFSVTYTNILEFLTCYMMFPYLSTTVSCTLLSDANLPESPR